VEEYSSIAYRGSAARVGSRAPAQGQNISTVSRVQTIPS